MKISGRRVRTSIIVILSAAGLIWFAGEAGNLLLIDAPQRSDLIVVLAGETDRRPAHALELLAQGYAARVLIDVPATEKIYDTGLVQYAEDYIRNLPEAPKIAICPIHGLSTREESHDVEKCLAHEQPASKVLIVTSDYHTRRSLSIFRHEIQGSSFSVAAAHDATQFGTRWWTHRQWAKTCIDEWLRLLWWDVVERWL
jgi:hypothetical protein